MHTVQTGDSNTYLIEYDDGLVMVDAGWPGYEDKIIAAMQKIGRMNLHLIFLI